MAHYTNEVELESPDGEVFTVEFEITSWGSGPTMASWNYAGDPGDPPEYEPGTVWDAEGNEVPEWVRPSWFRGLYMELWLRIPARVTNPRWAQAIALWEHHMEYDFDWTPPEPDYDDWRD